MAAKKAALGKGLSALLPSVSDSDRDSGKESARLYSLDDRTRLAGRVADLETASIDPNPYQPRQDFDEAALDELAASVEQLGIVQPITVRAKEDGRFELIAGERRLRAAKKVGLDRIPAFVREADTEAMLEMAIVENVQRENLNPVEVSLGYQRLVDECGLSQEEVAQKVGKSRSAVANSLRLLRLPADVLAALRDGRLSSGHARMLVSIEDPDVAAQIFERTLKEDLSVRQVEALARKYRDGIAGPDPASSGTAAAAPVRQQLQIDSFGDQLRDRLATQVSIRHKKDGAGKIEIEYYSEDDLERLLDLLLPR